MLKQLDSVREKKPLVHHITNWVTIQDCARITRAFGALPVMAHAPEEVAAMTGLASSLVLNIGTLTTEVVDSMIIAGCEANRRGIPVVLDAVGVGATPFRDEKAAEILDKVDVAIVKGNRSEIARLAGEQVVTRGVEAVDTNRDDSENARLLAGLTGGVVVTTGEVDIVTDGLRLAYIRNGHPLMGSLVGTGCMAASVLGAFAGAHDDCWESSVAGLVSYEVAGEIAAERAKGPGSFAEELHDAVYALDTATVERMARFDQAAS